MIGFVYKLIVSLSKRLGIWVFKGFSWWIATGYFFFIPGRVALSIQFYKALFPDYGFFHHFRCAWASIITLRRSIWIASFFSTPGIFPVPK